MIRSNCICRNDSKFAPYIKYQRETVFKDYEGIIIGKCMYCSVLKTFPPKLKFYPTITKLDDYEKRRKEFEKLFQPMMDRVIKYVHPKGTILDVGCSSGILLSLLKRKGFNVYGIEPNKKAYHFAQKKLKKNVYNTTLSDYSNNRTQKFDCIIYNHVLEHIKDINKEFKSINKILKPGGILVVGVPNTDTIVFHIRGKYWESLLPLEHMWHFNTKYVINLLSKKKFKVLDKYFYHEARSSYPIFKRIYFTLLTVIDKILHTGESVLLIVRKTTRHPDANRDPD